MDAPVALVAGIEMPWRHDDNDQQRWLWQSDTEQAKHRYGGVKFALERIDYDFGRKRRVGVSSILN
jgi:hypothetical protein